MEYFIVVARIYNRSFSAGPVWNVTDSLIPGDTQYLRYQFREREPVAIAFTIADLEKYAAGDAETVWMFEKIIHSRLDTKSS